MKIDIFRKVSNPSGYGKHVPKFRLEFLCGTDGHKSLKEAIKQASVDYGFPETDLKAIKRESLA